MTFLAAALFLTSAHHASAVKPAAITVPAFHLGATKLYMGASPLAIAAAPYGSRFVASFDDNTVRIIDANTRQTLRVFKGHPQQAYAVAWSSDGVFIASGDESARIFVWNAYTGQVVKQFRTHTRGIENLSFNREHNMLLSTGKDDFIKVYSLVTGKEVKSIPGDGANFYGARFDPFQDVFATGDLTNGGRIYKTNGVPFRFLNGHGGQGVLDLDYDPSGKQIITAGKDQDAILWDTKSGTKVGTLHGHQDWVMRTAFAPSGNVVVTSSNDRTVRLWNTKTLKEITELTDESAVGAPVRFTADGKFLLSSNVSDQLQVTPIVPPLAPVMAKPTKASKPTHHRRRRR